MKLHSIETGFFKLDGGAMFGVVPKVLWQKKINPDENNLCTWAMRCLLIEHGERLILIDTGIGDKQSEKFFKHYYLSGDTSLESSLAKKGFRAEDVTDVFLTHLHFDHVGGAVKREGEKLIPTFPNAKYWSNKSHWEWATNPNPREKASFLSENILPLQESGQLHFIDQNAESSWIDGIDVLFVNGHTEAQMLPLISYEGKKILYTADLLPSTHHIPLPWVMGYDVRPLETLKEKEHILNQAAAEEWLLFLEHDADTMAAMVEKGERGLQLAEKFHFDW